MEVLEIERKINLRVRKQMERTQKEYYLREQMKAIQKELGEKDERMAEADEYREKIAEATLPEEVEEKAIKEVERLEKMPPAAAEGVVIRNYLDWILALPWSKQTQDRLDLNMAEQILEEDHYGLKKVKERIIEYLAVRQLAKNLKGPSCAWWDHPVWVKLPWPNLLQGAGEKLCTYVTGRRHGTKLRYADTGALM
jgi:ATP-dependent Lon protease